ncbi:hypothetical protein QUF65_14180 [Lysinibacillus sphaericus]|uniref:hypothetical protein n=1 Tax=Lysinibacillus sphaericus TaxID=1421 RepID=UPI0025A0145A|nr:hypothetical protein [Lysinibacillus sphaericus]MDM5352031.1 hypothetical protein [Lysinibacillus sphaericus]
MEFKDITKILKRYKFSEKMRICQEYSTQFMSLNGVNIIKTSSPSPWDLETFALFSLMTTNEYQFKDFQSSKEKNVFVNIINTIKDFPTIMPQLNIGNGIDNDKFIRNLLITHLSNQSSIQENIHLKLYRYSYFFNFSNQNIDMKSIFNQKFNCDYQDFIDFSIILNSLFSPQFQMLDYKPIFYLINKYSHIVDTLTIERFKIIKLQQNFTKDINSYMYGFKLFHQYPFIKEKGKLYLPLPYLIFQASGPSLLFKITQGNNILKSKIGKEVMENYLTHITNLRKDFDEVVPEINYKKSSDAASLDLMIRKGDKAFLIDSKFTSPKASLRNLLDIEETTEKISKYIVQVYKHMTERFQKEYFPFNRDISKENTYGAVVVFDDSYVRREDIIKLAASYLNIESESSEFKYLCSNIRILNLYDYEQLIFRANDIFSLLDRVKVASEKWFDFGLSFKEEDFDAIKYKPIQTFAKENALILKDFIFDLQSLGIIKISK